MSAEVDRLKAENLVLRDEHNRLKGEQGRSKVPQRRPPATDISSEAARRVPRGRVRQPKNDQIVIDREVPCPVDPATLPPDAQFKGTMAVIVQEWYVRPAHVFRVGTWNTSSSIISPAWMPRQRRWLDSSPAAASGGR